MDFSNTATSTTDKMLLFLQAIKECVTQNFINHINRHDCGLVLRQYPRGIDQENIQAWWKEGHRENTETYQIATLNSKQAKIACIILYGQKNN